MSLPENITDLFDCILNEAKPKPGTILRKNLGDTSETTRRPKPGTIHRKPGNEDAELLEILSGKPRSKSKPLSPREKEIVSFINKKTKLNIDDLISKCPVNPDILYRYEDTLRVKPKIGNTVKFESRSFTAAQNGGGAAIFFGKTIKEINKRLCYAIVSKVTPAANISEYQNYTDNSMISEEEYLVTGEFKITKILDKPNTLYLVLNPV